MLRWVTWGRGVTKKQLEGKWIPDTTRRKNVGQKRKRLYYNSTQTVFLEQELGKGQSSFILRRIDRKLLMFSPRRLGRNLIQTESKNGIVITRAHCHKSTLEGVQRGERLKGG